MTDSTKFLRDWAADIRKHSGMSVDAEKLDAIADEIESLRSELSLARQRKISARNEINRAMDKYLKEDKP